MTPSELKDLINISPSGMMLQDVYEPLTSSTTWPAKCPHCGNSVVQDAVADGRRTWHRACKEKNR